MTLGETFGLAPPSCPPAPTKAYDDGARDLFSASSSFLFFFSPLSSSSSLLLVTMSGSHVKIPNTTDCLLIPD